MSGYSSAFRVFNDLTSMSQNVLSYYILKSARFFFVVLWLFEAGFAQADSTVPFSMILVYIDFRIIHHVIL
ncbi:uncharacterized protein B0P05DRAFT_526851 [Gilbertella persicaria]|uniref:uncharacterized protein n=1 Tax=Gilbertella persicaria TaxID=101096 RepID=UPI00221F92E5|nr:uncharacterized protein B0P05DRAFT_526851 [Gilbertella persicaria]KAI8091276.1 hypothetical protein B0P05DRAFT_526851 [Gilbertella persicaria]